MQSALSSRRLLKTHFGLSMPGFFAFGAECSITKHSTSLFVPILAKSTIAASNIYSATLIKRTSLLHFILVVAFSVYETALSPPPALCCRLPAVKGCSRQLLLSRMRAASAQKAWIFVPKAVDMAHLNRTSARNPLFQCPEGFQIASGPLIPTQGLRTCLAAAPHPLAGKQRNHCFEGTRSGNFRRLSGSENES